MSPAFLARLRTWLLIVMLLSIGAAVLLIASWILTEDAFGEEWLVIALMAAGFSFGAMLCVNILCRARHHALMWIGFASCVSAFAIWQPMIWVNWFRVSVDPTLWIVAGVLTTVLAGWCTLFAIFATFTRASAGARVCMLITLTLAVGVGVMSAVAALVEPRSDVFWQSMLLLCLVTGCGVVTSLALGVMLRVNPVGAGESISKHILIELKCPRCASMQALHMGQSRCSACGLRIEIMVEEPICVCGYQLYRLTGDTCPECGRKIAESDQWAGRKLAQPGIVFEDGPAIS